MLDRALAARPTLSTGGGTGALRLAAEVVEYASTELAPNGHDLVKGLQILAPHLIANGEGREISVEDLTTDLKFGAHYWRLRELLYYSYNAPGAIDWSIDGDHVHIRYADRSLPRQFFIATNNVHLESLEAFGDYEATRGRIEELIIGVPEFEWSEPGEQALRLIEDEVETKFRLYFNLFDGIDPDLGGFTWTQLIEVYRLLLARALYHRYHSRVNGTHGVVAMPLADLAAVLAESLGLPTPDVARAAVAFITYDLRARERRRDPVYYSLYHVAPTDTVLMLPHHFATWEGFVNILRLIGLDDPGLFSRAFSAPLGAALVERLATEFRDQEFECRTNVQLPAALGLPDIDLLVISHEPTLGFYLIPCEVKSPVPPRWAKDQLRALEPDSVVKAFEQVRGITEFLGSEEGADFVRRLLPAEGLTRFEEFAVAIRPLVITSDNAGAFFAEEETIVIDFRTMTRALQRSDGDVVYIWAVLSGIPAAADKCLEIVTESVQINDRLVRYDGVTVRKLMDFPQHAFRSQGGAEGMADEMLAAGDMPLDVLRPVEVELDEPAPRGEDGA